MKNASSKITLLLLFAAALLFAGCATTLTDAARKGDTKETERLIAAGADVNAKDNSGWTPLERAACGGKKEVAALLISKGADVNAKANDGYTPLDCAKKRGHTSVVSLLEKPWLDAETAEPSNPEEEAAFTEAAARYRAATVKPALPEDARKFKVQAEYAFNKKDFKGAIARYKEALDVAPWWPEGHFNRALILGELYRYRDAIREMKKYLTLVPDAPNARAAQDNIYRWEGELK